MTSIDLIPPEAHAIREAARRLRTWGTRLGMTFLLAALLYAGLLHLAAAGQKDLQRLSGQYASLQGHLRHAEDLLNERERLQKHREAIAILRRELSPLWFLESLGEALPARGYLTSLDLSLCSYRDEDSGQGDDCRPGLRLRGRAPDPQQVGLIIHELTAAGGFGRVDLVSISEPVTKGKRREVEFELVCELAGEDTGG